MRKVAVVSAVVLAFLTLGGCGTNPVATCAAGDTTCLEAAIVGAAAPAIDVSVPDGDNQDERDNRPRPRPRGASEFPAF